MSKYIDAEKLKAEIERRIEEYNIQSLRGAELSDLLSFIDFLQREQPEEPKSLDEVARKWAQYCKLNNTKDKRIAILDSIQFMEIAQYFYELGKNSK